MNGKSWLFVFVCMVLCMRVLGQHDVVKDGEASDYNLNKPEREEWLRNAPAGLFIHFSVDAQLASLSVTPW